MELFQSGFCYLYSGIGSVSVGRTIPDVIS